MPRKIKKQEKEVRVRMSADQVKLLDAAAKRLGISRASFVTDAVKLLIAAEKDCGGLRLPGNHSHEYGAAETQSEREQTMNGTRWTARQDESVRGGYAARVPVKIIAEYIDRTVNAVYARAVRLGLAKRK